MWTSTRFTKFSNSCLGFPWTQDFKYFWRKLISQLNIHVLGLDLPLVAALVIPIPALTHGETCHSDWQDSVWGSESKCLQFVIPKPAKSLLQFGMSAKYVVFYFGRWCHFGISIILLGLFLFWCVCVCLKQLQNPICCTALTCKWSCAKHSFLSQLFRLQIG